MTKVLLRALRVFGPERQLRKVAEECAECSAAAIRYLDDSTDETVVDHFAEELADVEIMVFQARQIIGDARVDEWKERKAKRLHDRLEVVERKRRLA